MHLSINESYNYVYVIMYIYTYGHINVNKYTYINLGYPEFDSTDLLFAPL